MNTSKTALITGTNRGIGKAILEEFAKSGINVIAHYRNKNIIFEKYLKTLSDKYNVEIYPIHFDITDSESMKEEIKKLFKNKIKIDILVNCAGKSHGGFFQTTPILKIKEIFEVNLFSQMELTQLVLKFMVKQKSGSIINISSVSGYDLKAGNSAYGTSKAAMIAWTKTLAAECAPIGIRVNSVAPGIIDTDMFNEMELKAKEAVIKSSSLGRLGSPDEVAKTVLFLATEDSSFITGQTIRVDGGII